MTGHAVAKAMLIASVAAAVVLLIVTGEAWPVLIPLPFGLVELYAREAALSHRGRFSFVTTSGLPSAVALLCAIATGLVVAVTWLALK